jgi:YHS domain-containing protein
MKIVFADVLMIFILSSGLRAQDETARAQTFNIKDGVALSRYDPVSYFEGKPMEGKPALRTSYKGVTYYFASQAHLDRFKAHPEAYEPAYGGWCAYAMGESGEKVKIDPETFKIIDGRLYLFYNFWGNNTLNTWNKNEKHLHEQAELNWKKYFK